MTFTCWPAVQLRPVEHVAALFVVEYWFCATRQAPHARFVVGVRSAVINSPGTHVVPVKHEAALVDVE